MSWMLVLANPQASDKIRDEERLRRGTTRGLARGTLEKRPKPWVWFCLSSWEPQATPGLTVVGIVSLFCPFQLGSLRKETKSGHPITWRQKGPTPILLAQAYLLLGLLCQAPLHPHPSPLRQTWSSLASHHYYEADTFHTLVLLDCLLYVLQVQPVTETT